MHLSQVQRIGRQTFGETFADANTEEDMERYLNESFGAERLTRELTDPNSEFYLATAEHEAVGYLKVNFGEAQTELKDSNAVEIERIYVSKAFHGKKVGQLLYEKALSIARERGADYVWLGVWEENLRAIAFYQKNGFVEFGKHIFKLGGDEQTDLMMRLGLT
jgi:diamine N-acetyltransferase